jgi:hypothetical protein
MNSRQAADKRREGGEDSAVSCNDSTEECLADLRSRIVAELLAKTTAYRYDGTRPVRDTFPALPAGAEMVSNTDIRNLPENFRPQLTGNLAKVDIQEPAYPSLLWCYQMAKTTRNPKKKAEYYHHFRQGLDILDLDPVTYEIIGTNPNSMGHWLQKLVDACRAQDFFRIPATTVVKVPMTLLQLTRQEYMGLSETTIKIVDEWAYKAFGLDDHKDYFIKTGTYSSKFDFRNAHVKGEKEVRELGEYLLFIQNYATSLAYFMNAKGGISGFYGVATTNEFVVRDYIRDKENNPCIYNGMPLHTEYRVFIEFDGQGGYEILGISPYWRRDVMISRFSQGPDKDTAKMKHDLAVYMAHEKTLYDRYEENKYLVLKHVMEMAPDVRLAGQWSLDIMQNGDDFYIIDMAEAASSALIDCVPKEKIKKTEERWITSDQLAAFSAQEHKKD